MPIAVARPCARGALALSLAFIAFSATATVTAQQPAASDTATVVRGRVVGPAGEPLVIERVVLHRVDASGGATVAEGPSGVDGRFELRAPASRDTSAVYFVAARYDGELYIGPPFRPALEGTPDQLLRVGVPETSASALVAGGAEGAAPPRVPARSPTNALLFIIPIVSAVAAVLYLLLPRRRVAPERALLIRIAEIDERLPAAPHGQRTALREERTRLLEQLRAG